MCLAFAIELVAPLHDYSGWYTLPFVGTLRWVDERSCHGAQYQCSCSHHIPIGLNRPSLGGTVPNSTTMSRRTALLIFCPTFINHSVSLFQV